MTKSFKRIGRVCTGSVGGYRGKIFAVLVLVGALFPIETHAQRVNCLGTNDAVVTAICASPRMLEREIGLKQNFAGALILADESRRKTMLAEQSQWEASRRAKCSNPDSGGIAQCTDALTEPRSQQISTLLPQVLDKEGDRLAVLDKTLDVRRVGDPSRPKSLRLQLRYGERVLVEGLQRFQVMARSGDGAAEAVFIRAPSADSTELSLGHFTSSSDLIFAVVVTRGAAPEVWPLINNFIQEGSLSIQSDTDGLTIAANVFDGSGRKQVRWTPIGSWKTTFEHTRIGEKLDLPIDVPDTHSPVPDIREYCGEPLSPALSAICSREDVRRAEISLSEALHDCLAPLTQDERSLLIERHSQLVQFDRRIYQKVPSNDDFSIVRRDISLTSSYQKCARDEVPGRPGNKIQRPPKTIVVGTKKLTEFWLPLRNLGAFTLALRLGTSVAVEYGSGHFEVIDEASFGETSVVILDTPPEGTDQCHSEYLLADSPAHPLRVWKLPNGNGCLGWTFGAEWKIEKTADGYLFTTAATELRDGIVYRWTPNDGLRADRVLVHPPDPNSQFKEYGQAIQRAEGPIVHSLTDYLYFSREVTTANSDFTVVGECDNIPRGCLYRALSPIRALFQKSSHALYIAIYDRNIQGAVCGFDTSHRPKPGIPSERDLLNVPIEYHPAQEEWPVSAREVLRTTFCPPK